MANKKVRNNRQMDKNKIEGKARKLVLEILIFYA